MENNDEKNKSPEALKKLIGDKNHPPLIGILIDYQDLFVSIRSDNWYVDIQFLIGDEVVELEYTMTMKDLRLLLCPKTFYSFKRGYVFNYNYVIDYKNNAQKGWDVIMMYGEDSKIVRGRLKLFLKIMGKDFAKLKKN